MASIYAEPPAAKPTLTGVGVKAQQAAHKAASLRADLALTQDLAHQAQICEALTRSELTLALGEALVGRAQADARARAEAAARYFAQVAPQSVRRYGRVQKAIDRALLRLGPLGQARVSARAGLSSTILFGPDEMGRRAHYAAHGAAAGQSPHPLFDPAHYARQAGPRLKASGVSALEHFLKDGAARGVDPHPLFDLTYYVSQVPVPAPREDPISHYLREGWRKGLSPSPLFDPAWYRRQMPRQAAETPPLLHYVTEGWRAGLTPHPLFDPAWYLQQYGDIAQAGLEPLAHFMAGGAAEGRNPGPWFDLAHHVAARGAALDPAVNPLVDYLQGGAWSVAEARPGFPTAAYLAAHPELVREGVTPLEHWARKAANG